MSLSQETIQRFIWQPSDLEEVTDASPAKAATALAAGDRFVWQPSDLHAATEAQSGGPFVGADADADLRVNALFATIMVAVNAATDRIFGAATMDAIRAALIDFGQRMVTRFGRPEQEFDLATQSAVEYLRTYGAARVNGISEETRKLLRNTLTEGLRAGEDQAALAARVRVYFRGISAGRAKVIALTEAHNATQLGAFSALVQAGVTAKVWRTQQDERVRPTHVELDGQIRHLGDPFTIESTGAEAMRPGGFDDPAEDVNCRCWMEAGGNVPSNLAANAGDQEWPRRLAVHERRVLAAVRRGLKAQEAAVLAVLAGGGAPAALTWDESKHPRDPGGEGGGQWVDSGGGTDEELAKLTDKFPAKDAYKIGDSAFMLPNGKFSASTKIAHHAMLRKAGITPDRTFGNANDAFQYYASEIAGFTERTGAIRIAASGRLNFQLGKMPTNSQLRSLRKLLDGYDGETAYVDVVRGGKAGYAHAAFTTMPELARFLAQQFGGARTNSELEAMVAAVLAVLAGGGAPVVQQQEDE